MTKCKTDEDFILFLTTVCQVELSLNTQRKKNDDWNDRISSKMLKKMKKMDKNIPNISKPQNWLKFHDYFSKIFVHVKIKENSLAQKLN